MLALFSGCGESLGVRLNICTLIDTLKLHVKYQTNFTTVLMFHLSLSLSLSLQSVSIVDVINNVLYEENQVGWEVLQQSDVGSQVILNNAERYAIFAAKARNETAENVTISRDNIGKIMTACVFSTLVR